MAVICQGLVKEQVSLLLGDADDAVFRGKGRMESCGRIDCVKDEETEEEEMTEEEENLGEVTVLCHFCC